MTRKRLRNQEEAEKRFLVPRRFQVTRQGRAGLPGSDAHGPTPRSFSALVPSTPTRGMSSPFASITLKSDEAWNTGGAQGTLAEDQVLLSSGPVCLLGS